MSTLLGDLLLACSEMLTSCCKHAVLMHIIEGLSMLEMRQNLDLHDVFLGVVRVPHFLVSPVLC